MTLLYVSTLASILMSITTLLHFHAPGGPGSGVQAAGIPTSRAQPPSPAPHSCLSQLDCHEVLQLQIPGFNREQQGHNFH